PARPRGAARPADVPRGGLSRGARFRKRTRPAAGRARPYTIGPAGSQARRQAPAAPARAPGSPHGCPPLRPGFTAAPRNTAMTELPILADPASAPATPRPAGAPRGKLFIQTHGCQMNEYDSARMADVLAASEGLELTANVEEADVVLVNTCSIREKAQEKVFSQLGRWRLLKEERLRSEGREVIIGV